MALDTEAQFYSDMKPMWERATALLGGTDSMRAAKTRFLPQFPGESQEIYNWRLNVAVLNNFYSAMAEQMVGLMFGEKLQIEKSQIPQEWLDNVDRQGGSVHDFAVRVAHLLLTHGLPHILVDYPKRPDDAKTLDDDKRLGLRPYWVLLTPESVFSASASKVNGAEIVDQVRWKEHASRRDGYNITITEVIRVLTLDESGATYELHERDMGSKAWVKKESGQLRAAGNKQLTQLPFVTGYANRKGFMRAKSTLDDVAHKNIEHWQSAADQRHILTVCRFPKEFQVGTANPVNITGPYSLLHSSGKRTEVEFGIIEAQGFGITAGENDLKRIVSEAESMAVRIITSDAAKTESGEQIDYEKEGAPLQKLAVELERIVKQALQHTAIYAGIDPAQAGVPKINKDFGLSADDTKAIETLLKARAQGDLSRPTLWEELRERGLFRTNFDPKKEAELIEDEKAANMEAALAFAPPKDDDENDDDAPPRQAA